MGDKKNKRQHFLEQHPFCCYCGGKTPATTQDHWPSRELFVRRQWPDGYVFPACEPCNNASSRVEGLFALVARMGRKEKESDVEWRDALRRLADGQRVRHPGVLGSMEMSATRKRAVFREQKWTLPKGETYSGLGLANINHPAIISAIEMCARKLLLSLYYRHTGRALTAEGSAAFQWATNTLRTDENLDKLLAQLPAIQRPAHHWTTPLSDQFSYRWGTSTDDNLAIFVVLLQGSFVIMGAMSADQVVAQHSLGPWIPLTLLGPVGSAPETAADLARITRSPQPSPADPPER